MKRLFKMIFEELNARVEHFLIWMPGRIGYKLRYWIYRLRFTHYGKKVFIEMGCYIRRFKNILLGNNVA